MQYYYLCRLVRIHRIVGGIPRATIILSLSYLMIFIMKVLTQGPINITTLGKWFIVTTLFIA